MKEIVQRLFIFGFSFVVSTMLTTLWLHNTTNNLTPKIIESTVGKRITVLEKRDNGVCPKSQSLSIGKALQIPEDIPIYPKAKAVGENAYNSNKWWHTFSTSESPNKVSSWYSERMKLNGWNDCRDLSLPGESSVAYFKSDSVGNVRSSLISVRHTKNSSIFSIVVYPDNTVVPNSDCVYTEFNNVK